MSERGRLIVVGFAGVSNLPIFAAQANGFYGSHGLDIDLRFTPNSSELRTGLAEGRYHLAQAAIDNAFALKDQALVDVVVVLGGDNGFNHLLAQPEIETIADIKGKAIGVDAANTAFALQLYEMLRMHGVNKGEYHVVPLGGSPARLEAMRKDKSIAAAIMSPPYSIMGLRAGLKDLGSAVAELGSYQASSLFALRTWAKTNRETLVKFLQATIEGLRWASDPCNRSDVVALLAQRLKLPEDIATSSYDHCKGGFHRDSEMDMAGVATVLNLRAQFTGRPPGRANDYVDLSFYRKAIAGL